jgi:hypothetical protein
MKRLLCLALVIAACGEKRPETPQGGRGDVVTPLAVAFREEAKGDQARARDLYFAALDRAATSGAEPWQIHSAAATIDALVSRQLHAFSDVTPDVALAFRIKDGNEKDFALRLEGAYAKAEGHFVPGIIARGLESLAEHHGDAAAATRWRTARGCAQEAVVIGPMSWAPLLGVKEPDPLDRFDARLEAAYPLPGAFAVKQPIATVRGRGCRIDLNAPSAQPGVRDVVIDVDVPRAQRIGLSLRAHGAAVLRAGGKTVLERPYELGGGDAARFTVVEAGAGKLRVVARVGMTEDGDTVEINAFDERGQPLVMRAPNVGDAGNVAAGGYVPFTPPPPKTDDERLTLALGALAVGDGRTAERSLFGITSRDGAPPELLLTYARAVETAKDLGNVHKAERMRSAYEKVLEAWPASWEAIVAHAVLAGVRRGHGEARIEALRDLELHRARAQNNAALLDAFEAATASLERLHDRAGAALERARAGLTGSSLLLDVERVARNKVGPERVQMACSPARPNRRDALDCYEALRAIGDRAGAEKELDRIRALTGVPNRYFPYALREALIAGDTARAKGIYDQMLPGEKTLAAFFATGKPDRDALRRLALTARDAPQALPPLMRSLGDDPAAPFEGMSEKITAEDRANPILPSAATAVLLHRERYEIDSSGILHFVVYDVRRVSGTTDVEQNAQADIPNVMARNTMRAIRRRIFKRDGRILEPDRTPRASQAHADLSQLEQGDAVEAIYEGWGLPSETGDIALDTPDLLPERTAVHDAEIVLKTPDGVRGALWSHPLLGKGQEAREAGSRVLKWTMKDRPARRLEEGIPKMDRNVGVSFSTGEWKDVALALRESVAALDEHDPEIAAWAREAARGLSGRAMVEAVVEAAGKAVREAQPGGLTDIAIGRAQGPQHTTARTILTDHEGTRTWVIARALRELGIKAEVVIAENEPYSADPGFPAHYGRFLHPLVVAHVPRTAGAKPEDDLEVWIDADVAGPPLPAGRISPELRGRSVLRPHATKDPIVPISPQASGSERDEVDIRLTVDTKGDAKGSFTIILRGRDAQELSEAMYRVVGAERQKALRGVVLAWVSFADVDEVGLSSSEGSWQVAVRADISVHGYAQAQQQQWILPGIDPLHYPFPRPHVSTLGATYAGQGARENALAINMAVQYHVHRRVELPSGATITRSPMPFEVKSKELEVSRKLQVSGNVVEDDFVLAVSTATVAASKYQEFVRGAHQTDDAFRASTFAKW